MPSHRQKNRQLAFKFTFCYFLLSFVTSAHSNSVTLEQALARVAQQHPAMKAQQSLVVAAQDDLSSAKQQFLPTLSASRTKGQTSDDRQLTTASIQQPLFSGGRILGGVNRSEAALGESQARVLGVWRELMQKTALAYIGVVKAQEKLKIADRSVEVHQELLASMQRRVDAEISPLSDLMLSQSRLAQAQSERLQVLLSLNVSLQALEELLEIPNPRTIAPENPAKVTAELNEALLQGLAFSPELRQLTAQREIAKQEVAIERAAALPSLFVRHDQLNGDTGSLAKSQTYLGIEFVPGAGFSAASRIKAAENRRLSAIDAQQATEKDARDRIRSYWLERESLRGQLDSASGYTKAAQSVAESFARQFAIGRKTWLEVLNARREALVAEMSQSEVLWNGRLAAWRLEIELGTLAPPALIQGLAN